jgi:hypothetical protein
MWNHMREWLPHGAVDPNDETLAIDLAGPGAKIKVTTNQLVLESKASMQARGLASPDDGDALALTFARPVAPEEKEEPDEEEEFSHVGRFGSGGWMR